MLTAKEAKEISDRAVLKDIRPPRLGAIEKEIRDRAQDGFQHVLVSRGRDEAILAPWLRQAGYHVQLEMGYMRVSWAPKKEKP